MTKMKNKLNKSMLLYDVGARLRDATFDDEITRKEVAKSITDSVLPKDVALLIDELLKNKEVEEAFNKHVQS